MMDKKHHIKEAERISEKYEQEELAKSPYSIKTYSFNKERDDKPVFEHKVLFRSNQFLTTTGERIHQKWFCKVFTPISEGEITKSQEEEIRKQLDCEIEEPLRQPLQKERKMLELTNGVELYKVAEERDNLLT